MMRISVVVADKNGQWKRRIRKRFEDAEAVAHVGVFSGSTNSETGAQVVEYAYHNEYGTKDIDSRPFMRNTFEAKRADWYRLLHRLLSSGAYDPRAALMLVAETAVKDIQLTIETADNGKFVANAPETVLRKKARGKRYPDQPLIDTGTMQESVTYEMRE